MRLQGLPQLFVINKRLKLLLLVMSFETFKQSGLFKQKSKNLEKLGFDFSNPDARGEYLKIQNLLVTEYFILHGSMITIMKKFDIPSTKTLDTLFREFNIQARSLSDANKLSILEGRSTPAEKLAFVHIWHTTWDGKSVLLRSSIEKRFAELLDQQQEPYDVECLRIKYFDEELQQYRIAIPDFYLPRHHKIIEVKSDYWLKPINMESKRIAYQKLGYSFALYLEHELIENWSLPRDSNPDLPY